MKRINPLLSEGIDDIGDDGTVALAAHLVAYNHDLIATALQSETDPIFSAWDKDYADLINTPTSLSDFATRDHDLLTGLTTDDDHTQYALLAGRSGGQTLIGGTASGNSLTLQSTSHATRGQIRAYDDISTSPFTYSFKLGIGALSAQTSELYSYAIGYEAMKTATGGVNGNFAIGYQALRDAHNDGVFNTAIGTNCLQTLTTGDNNTAIGNLAGTSITTGSNNLYIGKDCGSNNQTGSNNLAYGNEALMGVASNSNSGNIGIGYRTGKAITTGGNNIFIGYQVGDAVTTGGSNLLIGYNIDPPTATTSNYMNIGNTIFGNLSTNKVMIGASGGYASLDTSILDVYQATIGGVAGIRARTSNGGIARLELLESGVSGGYTAAGTYGFAVEYNGTGSTNTFSISESHNGVRTDYLKIVKNSRLMTMFSDLIWSGDGTGLPYGSFYGNEINFSSGALTAPQYVRIADTDCVQGEVNEVTYTDAGTTLTVGKAGRYLINWAISAETSSANTHLLAGIMVNSTTTLQAAGRNHDEPGRANSQYALSGTAILDLAANDVIGVGVGSDVDNITVTVDHINLTLTMVGGT